MIAVAFSIFFAVRVEPLLNLLLCSTSYQINQFKAETKGVGMGPNPGEGVPFGNRLTLHKFKPKEAVPMSEAKNRFLISFF
jgi:hypothetical protein